MIFTLSFRLPCTTYIFFVNHVILIKIAIKKHKDLRPNHTEPSQQRKPKTFTRMCPKTA